MASFSHYLSKWLRWDRGRQGTGYDKLLLAVNPFVLPFDLYLLRYPVGSHIPPHRDPVPSGRHFRLNIVIRRSKSGGAFVCDSPIYSSERIHFFRSDRATHSVTTVGGTARYVLSLGWILR